VKVDPSLILQLAERFKEAIRESRPIDTAQIQVVGLEAVKQNAGDTWPELSSRVRESSLNFLSQRLGPNDVVIPAGDGFLVIYAEPDEGGARRDSLQQALNAFYTGQPATRPLSANVKRESLGAELLMERFSRPQPAPFWEVAAPPSFADLPLAVLPMWSAAQEAITGYWIAPEQAGRAIGRFSYDPGWADTGWHRDDKDFLELDLRIADRAVSEIQSCLKRNQRCLVGFSVHSTTLLNRNRRRAYMQALSATPGEVRPFLLGRIAELQDGTPMGAVAEWAHQLRQIGHRLDIEIHHSQRSVSALGDMGLLGVACVMPSAHPSPAEVTALTRNVTVWNRDLKRLNLKLRLDNLEDPRLLGLALDVQVDACTSPRLWPATPAAEGMKPFSREQFLKALPATAAERRLA
jgi:hypothetical protein